MQTLPSVHKKIVLSYVVVLLVICAQSAVAGEIPDPSLEVSGFFDLLWEPAPTAPATSAFGLGQAEIDIEATIAPRITLCIAPAWLPDDETLVIATAAMFWQWSEDPVEGFCRSRRGKRAGMVAGRFDVPFGIDWKVYPSIDRPLITPPLVVMATHGGWNSDGVGFFGSAGIFNVNAHATSGFPHTRYVSSPQPENWTARAIYGGRLGLVPLDGLALGASGAWVDVVEEDHSMHMYGVDLQGELGGFSLRGEGIWHYGQAGDREGTTDGAYVEGQYEFARFYGIARWDVVWPVDENTERRLALGMGYPVHQLVILRGEYDVDLTGDGDDRLVFQMAAGF